MKQFTLHFINESFAKLSISSEISQGNPREISEPMSEENFRNYDEISGAISKEKSLDKFLKELLKDFLKKY